MLEHSHIYLYMCVCVCGCMYVCMCFPPPFFVTSLRSPRGGVTWPKAVFFSPYVRPARFAVLVLWASPADLRAPELSLFSLFGPRGESLAFMLRALCWGSLHGFCHIHLCIRTINSRSFKLPDFNVNYLGGKLCHYHKWKTSSDCPE